MTSAEAMAAQQQQTRVERLNAELELRVRERDEAREECARLGALLEAVREADAQLVGGSEAVAARQTIQTMWEAGMRAVRERNMARFEAERFRGLLKEVLHRGRKNPEWDKLFAAIDDAVNGEERL